MPRKISGIWVLNGVRNSVNSVRVIAATVTIVGLAVAGVCNARAGSLSYECSTSSCGVIYGGEIQAGDAKKLENAILRASLKVDTLSIASPGGDPFEALAMSAVLNKYFVVIFTGFRNGNGQRVEFVGTGDCASACALMFLTTDQRFGSEVFLHRPTFAPEAFRSIPDDLARSAYNQKTQRLLALLRNRGVPEELIAKMMSVPSDSLQRLESGYPDKSPWFEEWLAAKCGGQTAADFEFLKAITSAPNSPEGAKHSQAARSHEECKTNAISAAQNSTQHRQRPTRLVK